jgi:hypothetical protein
MGDSLAIQPKHGHHKKVQYNKKSKLYQPIKWLTLRILKLILDFSLVVEPIVYFLTLPQKIPTVFQIGTKDKNIFEIKIYDKKG